VGDQQREARDAVEPMPAARALEPDGVEDRDARQQQELDEGQVGAEQPGDAARGS
jgi:hypothetical protein